MLRHVGLDDHLAGKISASCPARGLGQQLKGPLRRVILGRVEREVRRQHADQRDPGEIVSLNDHLRADQDIRFVPVKGLQDPAVAGLAGGRVGIHPEHACLREGLPDDVLHLLRAGPEGRDVRRAAGRAAVRKRRCITAVVTAELTVAVIGHADGAVRTDERPAAGAAAHEARVAAAVQKEHDLFLFRQALFDLLRKKPAEHALVALGKLLPQVHDAHRRELCLRRSPFRQAEQAVFAAFRTGKAFQRRRCTAEHKGRTAQLAQLSGDLARPVAGR